MENYEKTSQNHEGGAVAESPNPLSDREASSEKAQAGPPPFPDGGLRAWLVVLGACIVLGCTFGHVSAFGVYQTYYQSNQLRHKTPSEISWIGSIQLCFQFATGLIAGALFDKFGARNILVPSSIVYVFSVMMTSICKEYYQFILAQGLLSGTAIGFLFTPALGAVNHYFMKKRGIAIGIVASGSSIGGVIIPIVLENCFYSNTIGFGWGVRIVGFGILFCLVIACILIKERLGPRSGTFFLPKAFVQADYSLLTAGVFFLLWGMFVPYFFLTDYAISEVHMSANLAFYLLAILNAASLFGRLSSGALADKIGWLNMLAIIGLINAILLFCWPSTNTNAGLIVWTVIFGFFSGAIFSLFPASLASVTPKPQLIGTYIGQATGVISIGALTGAPIAGAISTKYKFEDAAFFAGAAMLTGAILVAAARFCRNRKLLIKA